MLRETNGCAMKSLSRYYIYQRRQARARALSYVVVDIVIDVDCLHGRDAATHDDATLCCALMIRYACLSMLIDYAALLRDKSGYRFYAIAALCYEFVMLQRAITRYDVTLIRAYGVMRI